ncbi:MAG: hypothetical protein ABSG91_14000 [Syntrophobacteraceae bacterium]
MSLDVELSNVAMVGEEFIFGTATGGTGPFSDTLLGINGTYAGTYTLSNKGVFTVDIDTWIASVQKELSSLVKDLDSSATVNVTRKMLTGKVVSKTKIQGTIDVEFMVTLPDVKIQTTGLKEFTVPVSIRASLSGIPAPTAAKTTELEASSGSADSAESAATFIFQKLILPVMSFAGK